MKNQEVKQPTRLSRANSIAEPRRNTAPHFPLQLASFLSFKPCLQGTLCQELWLVATEVCLQDTAGNEALWVSIHKQQPLLGQHHGLPTAALQQTTTLASWHGHHHSSFLREIKESNLPGVNILTKIPQRP